MKYPPHLYTIEVSFGIEIPLFSEHFRDAEQAGQVLRSLKAKMYDSNNAIHSVKLYHQGRMVSQYFAQPTKPRWIWVPPPDADGIRRIPPKAKVGARARAKAKGTAALADLDLEI